MLIEINAKSQIWAECTWQTPKYGPLGWLGYVVAVLANQAGENNLVETV